MLKFTGFILLLCAYALLVPGLTQPILSVSGTVDKIDLVNLGKDMLTQSPDMPALVANLADAVIEQLDVTGNVLVFDKTQSILGTAQELYANHHVLVAVLIVLFSVVVPVTKGLIMLVAHLPLRQSISSTLMSIANASSKWSMADVFVIGIFIAFLAANGLQENRGLVAFDAMLGDGFYYFLGYCVVSILGTQLLALAAHRDRTAGPQGGGQGGAITVNSMRVHSE